MKLSIIIPAYNEEHRLPDTLQRFGGFFSRSYGDRVEIIVVANHCSDQTAEVARDAAKQFPQIRVIVEPNKIGKGGAVILGLRAAMGETAGFVDADGSTPPDVFESMAEETDTYAAVIGSRWVEGAVVHPEQSWLRKKASRMLNKLIVKGCFGLDLEDSQCGAKVFKREIISQLLPEMKETGWAFDIELLCRIKQLGYDIKEYPVKWHHVHGNTTTFLVMSFQMLISVWRVKKALSRQVG